VDLPVRARRCRRSRARRHHRVRWRRVGGRADRSDHGPHDRGHDGPDDRTDYDPTTPPTEPDDDADEAIESLEGAFAALRAGDCDAVVEHFTEEFPEREFSDCDGFLGETDLDYTPPTVLSADPMRLESNVSFGSEGIDMQFELVERKGDWLINQVDADIGGPDATTVTNVEPTCEEGGLTAVTSDCD